MISNHDNHAIIIKRPKKAVKGHHGGNWKVAYADFMTALMAFFLLLWILSGSDEEQLRGLADYFTPAAVPLVEISGIGTEITARKEPESELDPVAASTPTGPQEVGPMDEDSSETRTGAVNPWLELDQETTKPEEEAEQTLEQQLAAAQYQIEESFATTPELKALSDNLMVSLKEDGMTVEIIDLGERPMFDTASARPSEELLDILGELAPAIAELPLEIRITGHTDAHPFRTSDGYGNWELSTDRANAMRRAMLDKGIASHRIVSVAGVAAASPLIKTDPKDARNRRVTIDLTLPPQQWTE
ncbi:flagellar motor protein MotB [Neptunicoccus cionae]|uniref:flagellar motor protein MotB n=1 Tax=Neptunicoccus cionae TaxID=2035344 RepID=UPI000C787080|nr:flagellar motor protein MotB [Amylibacter cionae]PLS21130.1 chemotaxis protein MotB [Amylibacter cionae]